MDIVKACNKINKVFSPYKGFLSIEQLLYLSYGISEWIFSLSKRTKQREQKIRAHFPPSFFVCYFWSPTLSRFSVRICMTSLLFLCTGARPEICLSPKNIRIPAQEGRLGSSAAWAEGQRAGGEERRGEDSRGVEKERRGERLFWAGSQQPDSDQSASRLVPSVQWSRARGDCPVIGTALSIRKTGPEHRDTAENRSPFSARIFI